MRRIMIACIFLFICTLLVSCKSEKQDVLSQTYKIYYLDSEMTELVEEDYETTIHSANRVGLVNRLIKEMRTIHDANYKSALGENVEIVDVQYKDKQVAIFFSATYNEKSGTEEILSRAAIVKTLCGIEGIDYVEFYVEDQPLMILGSAVGLMNETTFSTNLEERGEIKNKLVTLYFSDKSGEELVAVQTSIQYDLSTPLAKLLVECLILGDETIDKSRQKDEAVATLPSSTVLNHLTIRDNICYLDFNREINNLRKGIRGETVIYSIVNTLCELTNVTRVQITVDGEPQQNYGEMSGFDSVLERRLDLIKKS